MNIEVSKITKLLICTSKPKLACVFSHQLLESFESDDFLQGQVDSLSSRFHSQHPDGFIGQIRV